MDLVFTYFTAQKAVLNDNKFTISKQWRTSLFVQCEWSKDIQFFDDQYG